MDKIDDGGPAFPGSWYPGMAWSPTETSGGMTLRDWFATHAPITLNDAMQYCGETNKKFDYEHIFKIMSQMRFAYATAMLKARGEP